MKQPSPPGTTYKYTGENQEDIYVVLSEPFQFSTHRSDVIVMVMWQNGQVDSLPAHVIGNEDDTEM